MRIEFFTVPILNADQARDELNRFIMGHRVISIDRNFVQDGPNSAWAFCIGYETTENAAPAKRGKIDYREVLSDQDFSVFVKLRNLRKEWAEREGVPAYAVFTNEQLAEMVTRPVRSKADILALPGVGEARIEKYGDAFLNTLRNETDGAGDKKELVDEAQSP